MFFTVLALISRVKVGRELKRYRKLLSDKLEIEGQHMETMRGDKERLAKENENLRIKVGQLQEKPEPKLGKELEILARAESKMMMKAPGFAPAWESAKAEAVEDMAEEDRGASLPKRLFRRFMGGAGQLEHKPVHAEMTEDGNGQTPGGDR